MSRSARWWTFWVLLVALALGGAYLILKGVPPARRNSPEQVPVGLVH